MDIESRWISDPEHKNKPDWAVRKTPKGWSDCIVKSRGNNSFVDVDKRISRRVGFPVQMNTEEKIPIILGRITKHQSHILKNATREEIEKLFETTKHAMRIDLAIVAKNKEDFPFPVFIEADGSQHERNGVRNNSSENHLDRVKDFCCRLNKQGIMVRIKSDENTSKKVEFIYKELNRYYDRLPSTNSNKERELLQQYTDAMCFMFAKIKDVSKLKVRRKPQVYITAVKNDIVNQLVNNTEKNRGFNPEEIKLFNVCSRERKDLSSFLRAFREIEGEKDNTHPEIYRGEYYEPYTFMEGIISNYRSRVKQENQQL